MAKLKIAKTLILGFCLIVGSTGVVYANASDARLFPAQEQTKVLKTTEVSPPDTGVSSPAQTTPEESDEILQKQRETDLYIFESSTM